jgi:hypothetical protein
VRKFENKYLRECEGKHIFLLTRSGIESVDILISANNYSSKESYSAHDT